MARPRKSDEEKKKLGTFQPCRSRPTIVPNKGFCVTAVSGLSAKHKKIIEAICSELPDGYITIENASLLERWARTYLLFRKTANEVERDGVVITYIDSQGNEGVKENPTFTAYTKLSAVLAQCERQLGFTPSTRANVLKGLGDDEETVANPFADLDA